mmetsp:Transcript_8632/g.16365  ORF Transcript_8632/g.16365 Transcript_8632/m.16365 type:complete len:203 (+) Transcript_8632:190-798(+)
MGQIWTDIKDPKDSVDGKRRADKLKVLFTALMSLTVAVQLNVVFMTTATSVQLMGGGFNPMATDAITFLEREFPYPYMATRFEFLAGLLTFMGAIAIKAWTRFASLPALSRATTLLLLATLSRMVAFDYMQDLPGIWNLVKDFTVVIFTGARITTPLSIISMGLFAGAIFNYVQALRHKLEEPEPANPYPYGVSDGANKPIA